MIQVDYYMNDGAAWQAQMVLAYVRAHEMSATDCTWNGDYYDCEIKVGRYENDREQGYVFVVRVLPHCSLDGETHQLNLAVYEHRNSDNIVVLSRELFTGDTPTWAEMTEGRKDKYDYDKDFRYNEAFECGEYVINQFAKFVHANYFPNKGKGE